MLRINFTVFLAAIPQPRPKARRIGKGIQIYTPNSAKIKEYKEAIGQAYLAKLEEHQDKDLILEASKSWPVTIAIRCFFKDPSPTRASYDAIEGKGLYRPFSSFYTKKPDVDNLEKGILDALKSLAWHDDSYVVTAATSKYYTPFALAGSSGRKVISEEPYFTIEIIYLDPNAAYTED